jgi:hypothetical protein
LKTTIDEFNADLTARVERYRSRARSLRSAAQMVSTALRFDLLDMAQTLDKLADAIELLRIGD